MIGPLRLRSRPLAVVGLLALGLIAFALYQERIDTTQAAVRAVVVLAALLVVERVVLPLLAALVGTRRD